MSFASATSLRSSAAKPGDNDKVLKESDARDRTNPRPRAGEPSDSKEDRADRFRDGRTGFRRRGETDQDSDGWSMVKPRKSFGHDGAERFHGRVGANDRFGGREERKPREREDADAGRDRPRRPFDAHPRDSKDGEEADGARRNGLPRKSDPWFKDTPVSEERPSQRERIDRAKSWRDRDPDDRSGEKAGERGGDRPYERRWARDRTPRTERDTAWFGEADDETAAGHTEEDFKKFMQSMKAKSTTQKQEEMGSGAAESSTGDSFFEQEKPRVAESAPAVEAGPDRFFELFGKSTGLDDGTSSKEAKENAKGKGSKSSRFTSFFSSQEETRRQTEPPTPAAGPPPPSIPLNGLHDGWAPV